MAQKLFMLEVQHLEVLILAPTGQDASLLANALTQEKIDSRIFTSIEPLCVRLKEPAGAMILAEEALNDLAVARINDVLERQEPWSDIPLVVMTGRGAEISSSLRVLKSFTPSGNVTLLERPFRPITLVSSLQVALRARRRQYQVRDLLEAQIQATRIRDEFISVASHELKTPLTSLKLQTQMNSRLMKVGGSEAFAPARVMKLIHTTESQVDRLTRLVEDMLDVSRLGSGKLNIQPTEFDLAELLQDLIERFMPQLVAVGCQVEVHAPYPVIGCWDRFRIEQVINNLLTNAIRYSPGAPVSIRLEARGDTAQLVVKDQGIGIAAEYKERIFERFERAITSTNISGLGLGLYICREIVESHQGVIGVESELGRGSTFTVELPLFPPGTAQPGCDH